MRFWGQFIVQDGAMKAIKHTIWLHDIRLLLIILIFISARYFMIKFILNRFLWKTYNNPLWNRLCFVFVVVLVVSFFFAFCVIKDCSSPRMPFKNIAYPWYSECKYSSLSNVEIKYLVASENNFNIKASQVFSPSPQLCLLDVKTQPIVYIDVVSSFVKIINLVCRPSNKITVGSYVMQVNDVRPVVAPNSRLRFIKSFFSKLKLHFFEMFTASAQGLEWKAKDSAKHAFCFCCNLDRDHLFARCKDFSVGPVKLSYCYKIHPNTVLLNCPGLGDGRLIEETTKLETSDKSYRIGRIKVTFHCWNPGEASFPLRIFYSEIEVRRVRTELRGVKIMVPLRYNGGNYEDEGAIVRYPAHDWFSSFLLKGSVQKLEEIHETQV